MTSEQILPEAIVTQRLVLRLFTRADVPQVHNYIGEPEMGRYLEGPGTPPTEEETANIVERHMQVDRSQRGVWAITINDVPVGGISINFEKEHRIAEIGYSIRLSLWGQGYATEAAQAVVDTAFQSYPQLQRIQANIHPQNTGSIKVAENIGMTYEGTLRAYAFVRGAPTDEAVYAVLRPGRSPFHH